MAQSRSNYIHDMIRDVASLRAAEDHLGAERLLAVGLEQLEGSDLRIELLEAAYAAGEELTAKEVISTLENLNLCERSWRRLLKLFQKNGDNMRAEIICRRFLKFNPLHEGAMIELIILMLRAKRPAEAHEYLTILKQVETVSESTLVEICRSEIRLRMFSEAATTAERGIEQYPSSFDLRFCLVEALHAMGAGFRLRSHIKSLEETAGNNAVRLVHLAEAAYWAHHKKKADSAIQAIMILDSVPNNILYTAARISFNNDSLEQSREALSRIDVSKSKDGVFLTNTLKLVYDLIKSEGPKSISCCVGASVTQRFLEIAPLETHYNQKLAYFQQCLKTIDNI